MPGPGIRRPDRADIVDCETTRSSRTTATRSRWVIVEVVNYCNDLVDRLTTVRDGGGTNHRHNLSYWMKLKDKHLTGTKIVGALESSVPVGRGVP